MSSGCGTTFSHSSDVASRNQRQAMQPEPRQFVLLICSASSLQRLTAAERLSGTPALLNTRASGHHLVLASSSVTITASPPGNTCRGTKARRAKHRTDRTAVPPEPFVKPIKQKLDERELDSAPAVCGLRQPHRSFSSCLRICAAKSSNASNRYCVLTHRVNTLFTNSEVAPRIKGLLVPLGSEVANPTASARAISISSSVGSRVNTVGLDIVASSLRESGASPKTSPRGTQYPSRVRSLRRTY